jgi:hypothetical protein
MSSDPMSLEARLAKAASDLDDAAVRYQTAKSFQAAQPNKRNTTKRSLHRVGLVGAMVASAASLTGVVWMAERSKSTDVPLAAEVQPATSLPQDSSKPASNELIQPNNEPSKKASAEVTKPVRDSKDELPLVPGEIVDLAFSDAPEEIRFQPGTTSRLIRVGPGMRKGWFKAREGQLLRITITSGSLSPRRVRIVDQLNPKVPLYVLGNDPLILPATGSYDLELDAGEAVTFELSIL